MNSVIYLRALARPSCAPWFVLIDPQQEYVAESRLLALPSASDALANCRKALNHARAMGFPVAFLRQVTRSPFFNPGTSFAGWIEDLEPRASDMVFERDKPSCYSSRQFSDLVQSSGGHLVLAGFAGETTCLSTAIDAFHRGHEFTYLADASASHELPNMSAGSVQSAVSEIIGLYGAVATTSVWIKASASKEQALEGSPS